jgi:LPXTG-motif cell wall-anchored protein
MRKTLASAVALLALTATTIVAADTSYPHASKLPLITGTVVSANDYQVVVETEQGKPLTLAIDSRTLLPADLSHGMPVQVEFRLMENGQHYASRIVPVRNGMGLNARAYGSSHGASNEDALASRTLDTLPQTGSTQPLILLLGLLGVGTGSLGLWTLRPLRA